MTNQQEPPAGIMLGSPLALSPCHEDTAPIPSDSSCASGEHAPEVEQSEEAVSAGPNLDREIVLSQDDHGEHEDEDDNDSEEGTSDDANNSDDDDDNHSSSDDNTSDSGDDASSTEDGSDSSKARTSPRAEVDDDSDSNASNSEDDDSSTDDGSASSEEEDDGNGDSNASESEDGNDTEDMSEHNEPTSVSQQEEESGKHDKCSFPMFILAKAVEDPNTITASLDQAGQITQRLLEGLSESDRAAYDHALLLDRYDLNKKVASWKKNNVGFAAAGKAEKAEMEGAIARKITKQRIEKVLHANAKLIALVKAREQGNTLSAALVMGHGKGRRTLASYTPGAQSAAEAETSGNSGSREDEGETVKALRSLRSAEGMGTLLVPDAKDSSDNDFNEDSFDDSFEGVFGPKKRKRQEEESGPASQDMKRRKGGFVLSAA